MRLVAALTVTFVLAWLIGDVGAQSCVTVRVRPAAMMRESDIDVQVRVARHADHRRLIVAWDSDAQAGGRRERTLAGDADKVLFQWWHLHQPAGNYLFVAWVLDGRARVLGTDRVRVLGVAGN